MSDTLCLGEAVVDLIAASPPDSLRAAERFAPHLGGAMAAVAVHAARAGARVSLAAGVGRDRWGRWLIERLGDEGVGVDHVELLPELATRLAFVTVDGEGVAEMTPYEGVADRLAAALADDVEAAVEAASGLCLSADALASAAEREVTMRGLDRARTLGRPVAFDCNLSLERWSSRTDAMASCNAVVPGALLVRADRAEATVLTGESDPARAALALRKAGAQVAVITLGADGVLLRGPNRLRIDLPAPGRERVVSAIGAGEALTGTLLAALERSGYYPDAAAAALDDAVAAAARAGAHWGACD